MSETWITRIEALLEHPLLPSDSEEARDSKRLHLALAAASVPVVASWALVYLALGRWLAALVPVAYCLATSGLIEYVWLTKDFRGFRIGHLACTLLAPFALHWYLGGFIGSGASILWSGVAVALALVFYGPRGALLWQGAFLVLVLAAFLREGPMAPGEYPLSRSEILAHFAMNTAGLSLVAFAYGIYWSDRLELARRGAPASPVVERGRAEPPDVVGDAVEPQAAEEEGPPEAEAAEEDPPTLQAAEEAAPAPPAADEKPPAPPAAEEVSPASSAEAEDPPAPPVIEEFPPESPAAEEAPLDPEALAPPVPPQPKPPRFPGRGRKKSRHGGTLRAGVFRRMKNRR